MVFLEIDVDFVVIVVVVYHGEISGGWLGYADFPVVFSPISMFHRRISQIAVGTIGLSSLQRDSLKPPLKLADSLKISKVDALTIKEALFVDIRFEPVANLRVQVSICLVLVVGFFNNNMFS